MKTGESKEFDHEKRLMDIRSQLERYAHYWKWFVVSMGVCFLIGFLYLRYSVRIYEVYAKILLQDEKKASGEMAGLAELANLAGRGTSSAAFVNDQIQVLQSRRIMRKVVDANGYEITYFQKGLIREKEIPAQESPLKMILLEPNSPLLERKAYSVEIRQESGVYILTNDEEEEVPIKLGKAIPSPIGKIMFVPNPKISWRTPVKINYMPKEITVDILRGKMQISPTKDVLSFAVDFVFRYASREKGIEVVNSLIQQYNQDALADKARVFKSTSNFINNRLSIISENLKAADGRLEVFKQQHQVLDLDLEGSIRAEGAVESEKELMDAKMQLELVNMMDELLQNSNLDLLPVNIGLSDLTIQSEIKTHNELLLERNELQKSASPQNPVLQNLEQAVSISHANITRSLANSRQVLTSKVNMHQRRRMQFEGKKASMPLNERKYKDIVRQQKTIETLYLFLLQKLEENEINLSATPSTLKVVDLAYATWRPVSPRKMLVLPISMAIGFLLPLSLLYLKFSLDIKVQGKADLLKIGDVSVLGEVPRSHQDIKAESDRTALAEAIRILRTNLRFLMGKNVKGASVYFVTSTIAGEGKSFIATNLAKVLSFANKRVLLIGADIRSPKILAYLNLTYLRHTQPGISNFLVDENYQVKDLIIPQAKGFGFDLIYSGYIAPNPAELLMNGRFEEIIQYGRDNYDFVIVDTAPVGLVTDTFLISELADLTIYVVRAQFLDKRLLEVSKSCFEEGKLKKMAFLLNDVDFSLGYGYGYGYGYGEEPVKKGWMRKFRFLINLIRQKYLK
ncbi:MULTISPECIES: GumC family protein [Sphingobacterium]|uniref:non-specific protein-tyrosine kinase n=1 Tax=Sphingobacterium tenebrionis TaxID=3111775 RepID=A0ABU8I872_9SPHI|nr:tyrosine-protein kinase [Sphingobacterium sp. CZ-2]QBR11457.1 polysaccharide biosynthesis tyrosine autokinase [Sphingobacterium sp. CZ-2]